MIEILISIAAVLFSGFALWLSYKSNEKADKSLDMLANMKIIEELDNAQAASERRYIYQLSKDTTQNWNDLPKMLNSIGEERVQQIERTINRLDTAGFLLEKKYSKENDPPLWIWDMAFDMWKILEPIVSFYRNQQGREKYGYYFEQLWKIAEEHCKGRTLDIARDGTK